VVMPNPPDAAGDAPMEKKKRKRATSARIRRFSGLQHTFSGNRNCVKPACRMGAINITVDKIIKT